MAGATTFITGAAGFIGTELVKVLKSRGHEVLALTWSSDAAQRARDAGATAIIGDLRDEGLWQDEVAADWVFHLPPHPQERAGATQRIVYVADTICYGATGARPITEDEQPGPSPWGRCLAPAFNRLDGYVAQGLPIVTALPGWVYGDGWWFRERIIRPVMAGRRVLQFGKSGPWVSPIHVHDCARALVHLAERGAVGRRYFLVNTDPIRLHQFAETFAHLANRPLRAWRVPAAASRLVVGSVLSGSPTADAVFSNRRLRAIGFRFDYPTLEHGLEQILGALDE
jgi:nucleoside-diphosphate-sugar epimerase